MASAEPSHAVRQDHPDRHVDVLVVGAGLSGIGAGYRLQSMCPGKSYAILEARDRVGGTWDLFRYPGIRSDSDVYTYSYPFRPWPGNRPLADGAAIRDYLTQAAAEFGIEKHIRFGARVVAAEWSSDRARWTVRVRAGGAEERWTCSMLYACTGYYDYDRAHQPDLPGRDRFAGRMVHPQFWPAHLDCTGRRVVVIGSGATAMTLVPSLARVAYHVTMLQRSPTYVVALPSEAALAGRLRRVLPAWAAHRILRLGYLARGQAFYVFCRRFPRRARSLLTRAVARRLGPDAAAEHFTPRYDPWDQRLCVLPDGDLLEAIRAGSASVVTDSIDALVPEGIRVRSGRVLPADVIVSATGLRLQALGGIRLTVDGRPVVLAEQLAYRGLMVTGLPNFAVAIGYPNASWTLRADLASRYVCRYLRHLDEHGLAFGVPVRDDAQPRRPIISLASGYVTRGVRSFPSQGVTSPWTIPTSYLRDRRGLARADLTEAMRFVARPTRQDGARGTS